MIINSINSNYSNNTSYKGGLKSLNVVNPIFRYTKKYFYKMAEVSGQRFEPISDTIASDLKSVQIDKASAWKINPDNSNKYVLFLHGISQNVSNYQRLYETIIKKGMGVLALEYRGYGTNKQTKISEEKFQKDVQSAYDYLTKQENIKPEDIIVVGHSMGGALAADFASKHKDIKSLILISPLTSLLRLSKKFMLNKMLGIGIPEKIQNFTERFKFLQFLFGLNFNSINKMKKMKVPTYVIQSKNDPVTTLNGSRKLVKTAKSRGVLQEFILFPQGGHKVDWQKIEAVSRILDKFKQ